MSTFDNLLGPGSAARQLLVYGVSYELARSLLGPMFTQIEYLINENSPLVELSPPELADMVVRGFLQQPDAIARAAKFGLDPARFGLMVDSAGEPPGLVQVLEWWRRGYLGFTGATPQTPSVTNAIATSRIYTSWTPIIKSAQFQGVSPADVVDAVQRNQITLAEGIRLAYHAGLGNSPNPIPSGESSQQTQDALQILLDTRGNPPAVGQLLELANRQIIPWGDLNPANKAPDPAATTFAQGIYEGDAKDKWLPLYAQLGVYLPPPRTVTTLLSKGAITPAQAQQYYQDAGLTPALAAAYVASATTNKTAKPKELSEANVITLLTDKLITQAEAVTFLEQLGYPANEATVLAATAQTAQSIADLKRNEQRVGTYYITHKIDRANALTMLAALGIDPAAAAGLVAGWDVDRQANVRTLTAAQIADALEFGILTYAEAITELEVLGYTPLDAWTVLSIKAKQPLPNKPAGGPGLVP